jgi:hypothetical protein
LTFAGTIERIGRAEVFRGFLTTLFREDWVVYAKPAFGAREQVVSGLTNGPFLVEAESGTLAKKINPQKKYESPVTAT